MSRTGWEQGVEVLVDEERFPILFDAQDRPLYREIGFRPRVVGKTPAPKRPRSRKRYADA